MSAIFQVGKNKGGKFMKYFTSDLHFCHDKEFCYGARGFKSVKEMNRKIIENINSVVKEDDELYILGDIYLGSDDGVFYFNSISCNNIYIIIGNHDTDKKLKVLKNMCGHKIKEISYAEVIKHGKFKFFLSHYPTLTGYWEKHINNALINLFGHTHQKDKFFKDNEGNNIPWMYNVACDAHNCTPISIEDIISDCRDEFGKYISRKNRKEED